MEKKKFFVLGLFMCLVLFLVAVLFTPAWAAEKKPIKLKLSIAYPARHPLTVNAYGVWAKKVEQRTNGQVKITIFPGGTLAKTKENYDATIAGVCDIGFFPQAYAAGRFPVSVGMNLPMLFPSAKVASQVAWDIYNKFQEIQAEYSDAKLLLFYCTPPYEIHTVKKPIKIMGDLKGLQIRAAGPAAAGITTALGGTPVAISMPEAYMGLQKGVLDGLVSPFGPMKGFKTADVTHYHTMNATLFSNLFCVVMNLKKWNSLSPNIQKIIDEESGAAGSKLFGTAFDSITAPDIKYMKNQGDTFTTISPEEKKRWATAIKPLRDKWVKKTLGKGKPAKEILSEMIRLSEKYAR